MVSAQRIAHRTLSRLNAHTLSVQNDSDVPVRLFAREDVSIEAAGIAQLQSITTLQDALVSSYQAQQRGQMDPIWGDVEPSLNRIVLTPDFHRGAGIPVGSVLETRGFLLPKAVGNDICCGMRLLVTDLHPDDVRPHIPALKRALRAVYFCGQRRLPMSPRQREALLREGLWGLLETSSDNAGTGLWSLYDPEQQEHHLDRVHFQGVLPAQDTFAFGDYIQASGRTDGHDSQIGSIGGGNHFVELQTLEALHDSSCAHAWGLRKDRVAIMVHSGSVGLGHVVGKYFAQRARDLQPKSLTKPPRGFDPIPTTGPHALLAERYIDALSNAANFAFANRLFLGLMALQALQETLGKPIQHTLVYDAPHNLIWNHDGNTPNHGLTTHSTDFIHRKGATPAHGPQTDTQGPFQYTGQPVIIPGSMGTASYLMAGEGNPEALSSACHGAGRLQSRGKARRTEEDTYLQSTQPLHIVTPIDPLDPKIQARPDILAEYHGRLKEEAPYAYKAIDPAIKTVEDAQIARRVARLQPLLTVKG